MGREEQAGWRLTGLALAWLIGIAAQLQQASLAPLRVSIVVTVGGVAAIVAAVACGVLARRARSATAVLFMLGAFALAFGSTDWRSAQRLADSLPRALEGRDVIVTGVVASLPQRFPGGVRFRFEVESAREAEAGTPVVLPEMLALGWYSNAHDEAAAPLPGAQLRAGQRWRFALRLRQPHGSLNPGGFDYELALFEQGVRATGYVRESSPPQLLEAGAGHAVERLRQRVRDAIEASVTERRAAGLLAALAVGDQGAIERDDWDLYRNTGVAHLVSISGLHITMFAWLAEALVGGLWRRSVRAALLVPTPLAARWGGVLLAAAYAVFSGWGVPSQRTVWMLATVTALQTRGARWPWPTVLLAAAAVVTLIDPWALLQAGFWLSFAAVALLMASSHEPARASPAAASPSRAGRIAAAWHTARRALWRHAREGVRTQLVATLGLAPLSLVFFQQMSLVGFAANLIAIPLVTLVITPLALLGVVAAPLWALGALAVELLNGALEGLARWPWAVWSVPVAPPWAQAAALLGAAVLMLPLPTRLRLLGLPLMLALALPPRELPRPGTFELIAVDVGQGTAVLLRTHAHLLVYDTGPQYSLESDAGRRVLVPLLRARGEARVDRMVLSHRDLDHVGGARAVFGALPVGGLLSSLEAGHPLRSLAEGRAERCEAGQAWDWDGVHFVVWRPRTEDYERALKSNAMSCVLRVSDASGRSVLLTGDLERDQEAELVARAGSVALRSDVLFAPHHGSRTSSSAALLDAVAPAVAVVQAGYRNRFGHPAPDVLARYRERGIRVVASPACGAWRWASGDAAARDAPPAGICQRDAARRYWQHRVGDDANEPVPGR